MTVKRTEDRLPAEIADDGCGGADPASGTGLRGLADRVEALAAGACASTARPGRAPASGRSCRCADRWAGGYSSHAWIASWRTMRPPSTSSTVMHSTFVPSG